MRVGLLALMAGRRGGGPETYEVELIRAIARLDHANEYVVYCTGPYTVDALGIAQPNFRYCILKPSFRPLSLSLTFPYLMRRDGLDFYHALFTPPPLSTVPMVFTMHCISSLVHPEFYPRFVAYRLNYLLKQGMRQCHRMVCVSQTTLEHVHEHYGVERSRMSVAYNGVGAQYRPLDSAGSFEFVRRTLDIQRPYILFVGKIQKHKNVVRLVEAYAQFRARTGSDTALILAGKPVTGVDEVHAAIARLGLARHVRWLGYVPDQCLPPLYAAARMFVFPSLWEGFGIPMIEAMSCGTPVVASNATCLPEVAGDAARIFEAQSTEDLAAALEQVESSPQYRETLIRRGFQRAAQFTWDNCARATLAAYQPLGFRLPTADPALR